VEYNSAHQLNIEVAHPQNATRGLPDYGKRFRQKVFQRRAPFKAFLELRRLSRQRRVGQHLDRRLKLVDLRNHALEPLDFLGVVVQEIRNKL
jgi:hypothetical protein